jgi:hypothetical protein
MKETQGLQMNKYNPSFEQNAGKQKKLVVTYRQINGNNKKQQTKGLKIAGETLKETYGYVRPERFNK